MQAGRWLRPTLAHRRAGRRRLDIARGGNVERPGFLDVFRRSEAGETGEVVLARSDRLARSAPDGGEVVRRIRDAYLDARLRALEDADVTDATAVLRAEPPRLAPLAWDDLTDDELHTIVAGAIDAVFLRRPPQRGADVSERARIVRRGHTEDDLPGKGRSVAPIRPFAGSDERQATRREMPA